MVCTLVFLMGKTPLVNTKLLILMNFLHSGVHRTMLNYSIKLTTFLCHLLKTLKIFNFRNFSKNNYKKYIKLYQKGWAVLPTIPLCDTAQCHEKQSKHHDVTGLVECFCDTKMIQK